jgi:hypothetical protein
MQRAAHGEPGVTWSAWARRKAEEMRRRREREKAGLIRKSDMIDWGEEGWGAE